MSLMEALVQLERSLDELARRWDLYLAHEPGAAMPGAGEVDALERRIREAGAGRTLSAAERGRLEQLAARFSAKAGNWRQLARGAEQKPALASPAKPSARPQPAPPASPHPAPTPPAPAPASTTAGPPRGGIDAARLEEYRHLFARYQAVMERAGEPIPTSLDRFVRELEEQRQRLVARGVVVEGFDIVREASGVHVRPRTRGGGH